MAELPGVVVSLCLWLWFVGTGLELVKVRQLFPVVVLVLIRIIMVGAHNVISCLGLRLLRPWGSGVCVIKQSRRLHAEQEKKSLQWQMDKMKVLEQIGQ